MDTRALPKLTLCALALALSACGGGGGRGLVATPPPASPPPLPPAPPPPRVDLCPAPVTSDCIVSLDVGEDADAVRMRPVQSNHALIFLGGGPLWLVERNRFSGGTRVEGSTMCVHGTLESDVQVLPGGEFHLYHTLTGNLDNRGTVHLSGTVTGDVTNSGRMEAPEYSGRRIEGDFTQTAEGTLVFTLEPHDWDRTGALHVGGHASLAGTLELTAPLIEGEYVLPTAGYYGILHADGGISGTFDQWTSPGLAITGRLRYEKKDVLFELTRISAKGAMVQRGIARRLPLAGAANLDAALAVADTFATAPRGTLPARQRRFLDSAGALLWLRDTVQAERSFDSLAGHAHAAAADLLLDQSARIAERLAARLAGLPHGTAPQAWDASLGLRTGGHLFDARATGTGLWLSPRLLVGASLAEGRLLADFDHLGGQASGEASSAGLHAHYRGDGWHATGALSAGRAWLPLQRPIELGPERRHAARSTRHFGHVSLHGEVDRDLAFGGGRLVPFASLDYGIVRGDAFTELGDTGLELAGGPSRQSRLTGAAGVRYARDWTLGAWPVRLELDLRHRRDLGDGGLPLAAFVGVPEVRFALPRDRATEAAALRLGLGGRLGPRMRWSLDWNRETGRRDPAAWHFAFERAL